MWVAGQATAVRPLCEAPQIDLVAVGGDFQYDCLAARGGMDHSAVERVQRAVPTPPGKGRR
jgi:hypothetical protein